jgi:hypothetical protein
MPFHLMQQGHIAYLMQHGHIAAVEFLAPGPDADLIAQGKAHFTRRADDGFDGFEVWDGSRRLYCYPGESEDPPKET